MVFVVVMALGFTSYSVVEGLVILHKIFEEIKERRLIEEED